MLIFILSTLTALVVSFICSMSESVLLSLNPVKLETLKNQGKQYAATWLDMKKNISRPISAILILNTLANTGGAVIAGDSFADVFGDEWLWLFSSIFSASVLLGTELFPKILGVNNNYRLAPYIAKPLDRAAYFLSPMIYLINMIFDRFKRPSEDEMGLEDLKSMANSASTNKVIEEKQAKIIVKTTTLHDRRVRDIMMPIAQMAFLNSQKSFEENLKMAKKNLHTRYPVSLDDDPQKLVGYVNLKEIIAYADDDNRKNKMEQFVRPMLNIESTLELTTALQLFIKKRYHIAIVIDEEETNIGMITLEDIMEEIVGDDIKDEFDH